MLDWIFLLVLGVAFVLGVRSTFRLWALYRRVSPTLPDKRRLILQSYVVVSAVVTLAAGYFGALSTRRILGYDPMPATALVSLAIATVVLFVPLYLDQVIRTIQEGEEEV